MKYLGDGSRLVLPGHLTASQYKLRAFCDDVRAFWTTYTQELTDAIETSPKMGITVWGDTDVVPLTRKMSLLFDTVFVADPIANFSVQPSKDPAAETLLGQALLWSVWMNALRELILADADPPIAVVCPQRFGPAGDDEDARAQIKKRTDAVAHMVLSRALRLNSSHESLEGLLEDARSVGLGEVSRKMDLDALFAVAPAQLNDPSSFAPSVVAGGWIPRDLGRRLRARILEPFDLAAVALMFRSAMFLLGNREANAFTLGADSALAATLWGAAVQRDNLLSSRFGAPTEPTRKSLLATAFQVGFEWLDNLSSAEVLDIRSRGDLTELRTLFGVDHATLRSADMSNFGEVARKYEATVRERLREYTRRTAVAAKAVRNKRRTSGISFGVATTLGIASLAFPAFAPIALGATAYGVIVGGSSVIDLIKQEIDIRHAMNDPRKRVIGVLLEKLSQPSAQQCESSAL